MIILKYIIFKVREHLEELKMAEVCDRPKILDRSKQIMEDKRSDIPAFERLYNLQREDGGDWSQERYYKKKTS